MFSYDTLCNQINDIEVDYSDSTQPLHMIFRALMLIAKILVSIYARMEFKP